MTDRRTQHDHDDSSGKSGRPRLGLKLRAGAVLSGLLVLACLTGLIYGLGRDPGQSQPRYAAGDLSAARQPPSLRPPTLDTEAESPAPTATVGDAQGLSPPPLRGAWRPLGTDHLGRDLLTRCLVGGAVSIAVGLCAAIVSAVIGTAYGLIAGYLGGRIDAVMMRIVDVLYGLPYVLLVVLFAVAGEALTRGFVAERPQLRPIVELGLLLAAIGGVGWLTLARVVRGQVMQLKAQPFIEAARAMGVSTPGVLFRHVLPNVIDVVMVYSALAVPQAMLQESFLSFLGIGVRPPLPSWGSLIADGLSELNPVRIRWWLIVIPCMFMAAALLSLNIMGEGMSEWLDPKNRVDVRKVKS